MSSEKAQGADNQQGSRREKISDEYLAGFIDGEGCFYVGFGRRRDLPLGWQVLTEFHVSQNPGGKNILYSLKKRLGCGYLKPNHPGNTKDKSWVLIVKDRKDLEEKVLPFFEKNPLYSSKREDLEIFQKTLKIINRGEHLKKKGFEKILELVFNSSRRTNKRYSEEFILSSIKS